MTDKAYFGVYVPEGDGTPEALFKDADKAQVYRKATYGDRGVIAPTANWGRNDEVADAIAVAELPPDTSALDAKRAEVRTRIWRELEEEAIEEEIRSEIEKEFKEARKASSKKADSKGQRAVTEEEQVDAELASRAAIELGKPVDDLSDKDIKEFKEAEEAAAANRDRQASVAATGAAPRPAPGGTVSGGRSR